MSTYPKASQVILTKEYMANLIAVAPTCKNYWGGARIQAKGSWGASPKILENYIATNAF